jgi:hypothetical protein
VRWNTFVQVAYADALVDPIKASIFATLDAAPIGYTVDLPGGLSAANIETDLRDVVATKLDLLEDVRQRHHIVPSPLHVVTIADALDLEQLHSAAAVFDHDLPLMVPCESALDISRRRKRGTSRPTSRCSRSQPW